MRNRKKLCIEFLSRRSLLDPIDEFDALKNLLDELVAVELFSLVLGSFGKLENHCYRTHRTL